MTPVSPNAPVARANSVNSADSAAQTDRARAGHADQAARSDHCAALYRGRTTFAYARHAQAKLLANKSHADKLRDRLAQAKRARAKQRGRFAQSAKAAQMRQRAAGAHASLARGGAGRHASSRVTRDGGRGGGQRGGKQQSQQDGQKDGQGQQPRRPREWRVSGAGAGNVVRRPGATADRMTMPDWLSAAMQHDADAPGNDALIDGCCDALLALRDEIGAGPAARLDARLYRLAYEGALARGFLGEGEAAGFAAIRVRLVERAAQHAGKSAGSAGAAPSASEPMASVAPTTVPAPRADALRVVGSHAGARASSGRAPATRSNASSAGGSTSRTRLHDFNLLLPLHLLMLERPLIESRAARTAGALASLSAGAGGAAGSAPDETGGSAQSAPQPDPA